MLFRSYEASVSKLFGSELTQKVANTGVKACGLYGNLWDEHDARAALGGGFTRSYVRSVSATIAGGTSEIQRVVIARHVLKGLRDA